VARARAFSLVELVAVMTVMALLFTVGIGGLGDSRAQARQVATERVIGMLEQARGTALTSRCVVALALAEPGDLPSGSDEHGRLGLFKINEWPAAPGTLDGTLLHRWLELPGGVVILPGSVNGVRNPRDEPQTTIRYLVGKRPVQGRFHIIAFTPRGSLQWPAGSDPLALRIAEGTYRNGQPFPNSRSSDHRVAENVLKLGRLTARPYQFDR